jgi:hypothetical protein
MAYTIGEFSDNNIPYNYFSFANNTHNLIIDIKGQILKFQPFANLINGSQDAQQIVFVRAGLQFQHYRIDNDENDKVVSIFHENSAILRFNYTSYFHMKREEYQDVKT